MEINAVFQKKIRRVGTLETIDLEDNLAVEEPLEIRLKYLEAGKFREKSISVTMRTPGNDEELAAGFLFTEGIIRNADQVESIQVSVLKENSVLVTLADNFSPGLNTLERNFYTTSSCGVCGKASIDAIKTVSVFAENQNTVRVDKETLLTLKDKISESQLVFENTGGLHASALFDLKGNLITLREDVGRHNALDKLIGNMFMDNILPLSSHILLLSGRASFELIQKASMAGIQIVAAIGAPSSLAVELAEESGITLIGFLKNDRFNVYTGFDRIEGI
ncbi:formate dehydrogenase accessory sulfurtransferase FdhD [Dyadobacter sp. CY323]|uniref:formate dehydrogenase accessory sulfurtransferase FdhD n=1 Tax=Dyadobacter sp. CY323 TaxID=2907302 RepID=UPI001F3D0C24|nr:formate dehydrogenase accessory sulfurtransferase FdhD [Dyadobacter sp. CY323]MCE6989258.1 formate dehydrogenase accessory sulfurtransferase FdhD [Dyadobacter sp. CY323]